jgi:hypothetical protein
MQSTDRLEFVRVLNGLAAVKRVELTKEAIELWWASMSRWSIEDFKAAASHLVSSCQFMPTPYDFQQLRKAGEPTAAEAWTLAIESAKHWRTPEKLPFGRIGRAVRALGGYRALAMADTEKDLPHYARRFKDAYEEMTDVDSVREALPELTRASLTNKQPGLSHLTHALEFTPSRDE